MTAVDVEGKVDERLQWRLLQQLWPFVRPYRAAFGACMLILLLSFGLEMTGPQLLQLAIDGPMRSTFLPRAERVTQLWWFGGGFLLVTALGAWCSYVYGTLSAWNGQRVIRDVRARLFAHLLAVSPSYHERNPAGKLTTRVTSDVENLNELISTGVLQSLFDLLKIAGVLVLMFVTNLQLALFTLGSLPVVVLISVLFRNSAQRAYQEVRSTLATQNGFTAEVIGGVRATRAFGREREVLARYQQKNATTTTAWLRTVLHFSLFFALVDSAIRITTVGMLLFGGRAVLHGEITIGQFTKFWLYFGMLSSPIKELGEKYNVLQSAVASASRILGILAQPVFPPPATTPRQAPARRGAAAIDFDDVHFEYLPGRPVLQGIRFAAAPGQRIAVVGPTGAGKTTLLALVSRLRDTTRGAVRVDGIDVRDWEPSALRSRVAVVAQDLFLFTGSVLDNVRLFDPHISEDRVWQALEVVGAAEFVRKLPDGLHNQVEERGATFSQGERQLLSFARALVTEPDVLVLDEATASIDSKNEQRLQAALAVALQGRTALVVAHRLSTVRDADVILVLDQGRIIEQGDHAQLLQHDGAYAHMLQRLPPQRR